MDLSGVDLSFDKVSIVGVTGDLFEDWQQELGLMSCGVRQTGADEYMIAAVKDGLHVQYRSSLSALGGRGVPGECTSPDAWNVRLEWNPNKAGAIGAKALAGIAAGRRMTRLDLAIDYEGLCLSDYTFTRPRVKTMTVNGWHGLNETVYLGKWGSRRFVRCYDKAREMGIEDAELLRVETVQRYRPGDTVLPEGLMHGFSATAKRVPHGVSIRDAGLLALFHHEPERLQSANPRTRSRAADLAERYSGSLTPGISEVYDRERERLRMMADDLLEGAILPVAAIYEKAGCDHEGEVSGA